MGHQAASHRKPARPTSTNAQRQPRRNSRNATTGGARMAPIEEPLLKMPEAKARSLSGNHSATTLTAPGQFPASPMPSKKRQAARLTGPFENAWSTELADHQSMHSPYPTRVPSRSINGPETPFMIV